MSVEL